MKLPHNAEAEGSIITAALNQPSMMDEVWTPKTDDFFVPMHKTIWQTMQNIHASGKEVELPILAGELEGSVSVEQILDIMNRPISGLYTKQNCEIVVSHSRARRLMGIAAQVIEMGSTGTSPEELLGVMEQADSIESPNDDGIHIAKAMQDGYRKLQRIKRGEEEMPLSITIGHQELMQIEAPDLAMVLAATGGGKSLMGLQIAADAARKGWPVMVYTLEMSAMQHGFRFMAQRAGVNVSRARRGGMTDVEEKRIEMAIKSVETLPIYFNDQLSFSSQIISSMRKHAKRGVKLFVLDYLGLVELDQERAAQNHLALERLATRIKRLCMAHSVSGIVLHQLNRGAEEDEPSMKNIADAYGVTRPCDQVYFIYRPAENGIRLGNTTHWIAGKIRNDPLFRTELRFNESTLMFVDPAEYHGH